MLVFDDCYGVSWLGMGIYLLLLIVGWFLGIIMHFGTIFMLRCSLRLFGVMDSRLWQLEQLGLI